MIHYLLNIFGIDNCNKIVENIFIGDEKCSQNLAFIKQENINVVVNCSRDLDFFIENGHTYRIPVDDNFSHASIRIMYNYIIKLVPIINNHLDKGDVLLIHCRAGIQRSATFLTALLMYRNNLSKKEQWSLLNINAPSVFYQVLILVYLWIYTNNIYILILILHTKHLN